ncbi:MAG: sigma-70 family RNA polymerase sigma factor [Phycisphaerae bacterium]|nr:sigma-70 family RNA polymerase sigma factor [Phycisphaerae bacterium]
MPHHASEPPHDRPVTELLAAAARGEEEAASRLLPLLYGELRALAESRLRRTPAGNTLQATALVHEAYVRLVGKSEVAYEGRGHFFFAAARAMHDILVERARRRASRVRSEATRAIDPELLGDPLVAPDEELLALHQAMETLRERDARKHELVLLRFFGGLEFAAIAELLGVSERTVMRDWRFARAFLHEILSGDRGDEVTRD